MNFSITPLGNGLCRICVDGVCEDRPCVDTMFEKIDGKLVLSFGKNIADDIQSLVEKTDQIIHEEKTK